MHLMKRIGDDLILQNSILIDNSLEIDPDFDLIEFTQQKALH